MELLRERGKASQFLPFAWCHPEEPSPEVEAWPESLGKELKTGHTEMPSVSAVLQGGQRVEVGSAFLI